MSETSVKIIKNEIRCRDDTVPKTRSHCKVYMVESMQPPLPQPAPYISFFWVAEDCCMLSTIYTLQWLLVSTVFGTVSSLHLISFLMIFTLVILLWHDT